VTSSRGPLVGTRLRVPALAVGAVAVALLVLLAVRYAGQHGPGGVDRQVDGWLDDHLGAHQRLARDVADLANAPVLALVVALIGAGCLLRGWPRGAVLAVAGPGLAAAITHFLLKPLVGRTIDGGLAFPSGHTTGAVATALVVVVLALRARLARAARAALVLAAAAYAGAVVVALIVGRFHYATDTVGGACVAVATVLGVALAIDALSPVCSRSASGRGRVPSPPRPRGRASARRSPTGPATRS
jgi:undecaprenyl-diphosphatase